MQNMIGMSFLKSTNQYHHIFLEIITMLRIYSHIHFVWSCFIVKSHIKVRYKKKVSMICWIEWIELCQLNPISHILFFHCKISYNIRWRNNCLHVLWEWHSICAVIRITLKSNKFPLVSTSFRIKTEGKSICEWPS